jgi:Tol biopolymer transport system component
VDGVQADGDNLEPALSADGTIVAFTSRGHSLTENDSNGFWDILVKDRRTGLIENITNVNLSALNVWGGLSQSPRLSADGRYVAFMSLAKFNAGGVVIDPVPAVWRPYLYDRVTGTFVEVVGPAGVHFDKDVIGLALSGDGRYMVLTTASTNLGYSNTTGRNQVLYCDLGPNRDQPVLTLLSYVSGSPTQISNGANQDVWPGSISADGELVVFDSTATDILPGQDADPAPDIYLWRRSTGVLSLASVGSAGAKNWSFMGGISGDGSTVGYIINSVSIPGWSCELLDLATGQRRTISDPGAGVQTTFPVRLSGDGRRVVYTATGTGVSQPILFIDGVGNQWLAQSTNGATSTVMVQGGTLSQDGRWGAWTTAGGNMVTKDTNGLMDIFVRGPF